MMLYLYDDNGKRVYPYIVWYVLADEKDLSGKEACKLYFAADYPEAKNIAEEHTPKGFKVYNIDHKMPVEKGIDII